MTGTAYLLGRALLAVLLMLAFYGLALAMILLLLGGLYVQARFGKFNLQLTLFCLTGVYFILKGARRGPVSGGDRPRVRPLPRG